MRSAYASQRQGRPPLQNDVETEQLNPVSRLSLQGVIFLPSHASAICEYSSFMRAMYKVLVRWNTHNRSTSPHSGVGKMVCDINQQSVTLVRRDEGSRINAIHKDSATGEAIRAYNAVTNVELVLSVGRQSDGKQDPDHCEGRKKRAREMHERRKDECEGCS